MGYRKKLLIILIILLLLLLIGLGIYWFLLQNKEGEESQKPTATSSSQASPSAKQNTPLVDDEALIKKAVMEKTKIAENNLSFSISNKTATHAKGYVSTMDSEGVGGGYWLAAKVNNVWIVVYSGQANPNCDQIDPYAFPVDMVPECLDVNGNVVVR